MACESSEARWLRTGRWCATVAAVLSCLLVVRPLSAQQGQVGGQVVSAETLRPLPDATVEVVGMGRGTFTNQNGR
ncbi:MAG: hypothetical protein PVJ04_17565, partial [Gemmatimonadota bacterium]